MTSRFLITGGAGFIGSHLADQLQKLGAGVVVLDDLSTGRREHLSAEIEFINGSVLDTNLITKVAKGCTGIFHLAAIASVSKSNEDWIGSHRVNQTGTLAVFNASRALGGMPVVYASSAAVYGNQRVDRITEQAVVYGHFLLTAQINLAANCTVTLQLLYLESQILGCDFSTSMDPAKNRPHHIPA